MSRPEQDSAALVATYGDLYNSIARPERKYAVSHYLRTRWAPLLGAARFWFVIALRQRCFWNGKQDWCVVDMETLAHESGLSLRTVNRIVAASDEPAAANEADGTDMEDDRDGLAAWFFDKKHRRRYNRYVGRTVNAPNHYHVLLDDPLTPADQAALTRALRRALNDRSPEGTLMALQRLCERGPNILYERDGLVPAEPGEVLPGAFVFDLVELHCPLPDRESVLYAEIARAASRLHNILTRPEHVYVGNQYFRLQWLPQLGPVLSSLVINLRARCYWNERTGELRDTCQASWSALAEETGCTSRQLRNLRKEPHLSHFFTILHTGRGRAPSEFQVSMADPLTDADQRAFAAEIKQQEDLQIDPETGQIDAYALLQKPELLAYGSTTLAARMRALAPASESTADNAESLAPGSEDASCLNAEILASGHGANAEEMAPRETLNAEPLSSRRPVNPEVLAGRDRKSWHVEGLNPEVLALESGSFGTTEQIHVITPTLQGLAVTALPVTPALAEDEDALAAAVRNRLFEQLDIQQPGRGRLHAHQPRCDWIVAWGLYALVQPGLSENKAGYIYRRLIAKDPPPSDALLLAGLSPPAWRALYRAQRYGEDERRIDVPLRAGLSAWRALLGPVWKTLQIELGGSAAQVAATDHGAPALEAHARGVRRRVPSVAASGEPLVSEPATGWTSADALAAQPPTVDAQGADVQILRALEMKTAAALPPPIVAILNGEEEVSCTEAGYEIAAWELYHAYQLARAVHKHGVEDAVSVVYCARDGREYELNAEVLALELEALPRVVWRAVEMELPLRLSGPEQERKWRGVEPLGISAVGDTDEGPCVVLCVSDEKTCAWLRAFHSTLAAETIGAALGQRVRVSLFAHRPAVVPEPSTVPL